MNFQELIKNKAVKSKNCRWESEIAVYEECALMARNAIIDLLLKINDENYNVHGEHINQSCREEAETIERIIDLIKYGNKYE